MMVPRRLPQWLRCNQPESRRNTASAFSMAEAVMSLVIVGVMLVAALNTVGATKLHQSKTNDWARGALLAQELLTEILSQSYVEPTDIAILGLEGLESLAIGRSAYDDVDDYNGWSASPPQNKDGTVMAEYADWGHSSIVTWVDPLSPATVSASDQGAKRVVVTVTYQGRTVATLNALRTAGKDAIATRGQE